MLRMWDKPCSRCQCGYQPEKQCFEYPGKQGSSSLWRQSSMSGYQSNDFDEAGMLGRKTKPEWQSSSVIASFNCCLPSESAGRCLIPVAIGLGLLFASIPFFFFTDIIESHMLINNHLTKLNESISMLNNTVRYLAYQNAQLCNIAKLLKLATTEEAK